MRSPPFIVGVAGGSASGKTTLARELVIRHADAAILAEDSYYRCSSSIPDFNPAHHNFDEPAAKDHVLLARHLDALRQREAFEKPVYAFATHTRAGYETWPGACALVIVEGLHVLASEPVRRHFDLTVFIDAEREVRRARRVARDVAERGRTPDFAARQFDATVEPMHAVHIAPQRALADMVLDSSSGDMPGMVATVSAAIVQAQERTAGA